MELAMAYVVVGRGSQVPTDASGISTWVFYGKKGGVVQSAAGWIQEMGGSSSPPQAQSS